MDVGDLLAYFNPMFTHNWTINRPQQMALIREYQSLIQAGQPLPSFEDAGFRAFSQTDEDGALLLIFSAIGFETRKAVEICCGDGIECIAANWVVNHHFDALMIDGDGQTLAQGASFYQKCRDTGLNPPTLKQAWVTAEGVNDLVQQEGFSGDIDLLSLDLDGVDYWVWQALDTVRPRVAVIEYNPLAPKDRSATVPYSPDFQGTWQDNICLFGGASLKAMQTLGRSKGYRLIGVNSMKFNAYFVREDLGTEHFPEISAEQGYGAGYWSNLEDKYATQLKSLTWVDV